MAQSKATQHKAKPNHKSKTPDTGRRTGLNHLSRGPGTGIWPEARVETYAPDRHRDALPRQRATLSSLSAPQMKTARKRCRPASLHRLVSQVPEQCQGRGPKAPDGLDQHRREGQGGGHLPIRAPLGGVPSSDRKPGAALSAPSKGRSPRVMETWAMETSPTTSWRGITNMKSSLTPGPRGGRTPRGSGERKRAPGPREEVGSPSSARAAAEASAGASGTRTGGPAAEPAKEEASAGPAGGLAGDKEGVEKKRKGGSTVV
jgi:hypothetical protein